MPQLARHELTLIGVEGARRRNRNTTRGTHKNQDVITVSREIEHTQDSVFNRPERAIADSNLDDEYNSDHERLAGSRESPDLRLQLEARRAQREQQAKSRPPIRATPEEERLSQMQAQIDRLLAERSIPDPVWEVLSKTQSPFPASISSTIPPKNFKMLTIPLYDGKIDPGAHVQTYRTWMNIAKADAATLCNVFPLTLSGPA